MTSSIEDSGDTSSEKQYGGGPGICITLTPILCKVAATPDLHSHPCGEGRASMDGGIASDTVHTVYDGRVASACENLPDLSQLPDKFPCKREDVFEC